MKKTYIGGREVFQFVGAIACIIIGSMLMTYAKAAIGG